MASGKEQLLKIIRELIDELDKLKNKFSEVASSNKQSTKETNKAISDTVDVTEDLLRIQSVQLRLDKEINTLTKKQNDLRKEGKDLTKQQAAELTALKTTREANNRELKTEAKLANTVLTSMNNLSQTLAKNKLEYRKLTDEERKNNKVGGQLLKTIKKQDAQIKKLDKTIGDNQRSVGDYASAIGGAGAQFGILGTVMNQMKGAFNVLKVGFSSVKAAIASTGIGLLLIAFASLVEWFRNTAIGAERLREILVPIKAIFGTFTSTLQNLGQGIVTFFSDSAKGWEQMKGAISNVNNELENQLRIQQRLADLHTESFTFEVQNKLRLKKLENEAAEQRKIAMNDAGVALDQQLIALKKSEEALLKVRDIKEKMRQFDIEQVALEINAGNQSEEILLKFADLQAKEFEIQKSYETQMITLVGRRNTLLNKQKQVIKEVDDIDLSAIEAREEREAGFYEDKEKLYVADLSAFIEAENAKKEAAIEADKAKRESQDRLYEATNQSLTASLKFVQENTAEYKLLAVAQASLNAYLAASQALTDWKSLTVIDKIASAVAVLGVGLGFVSEMRGIELAEGIDEVKGGTKGKDSVRAMLMPGERVMTVQQNKALHGISNDEIPGLVAIGKQSSNLTPDMLRLAANQLFETEKQTKMLGRLCWVDNNGTVHNLRNNDKMHVN